MLLKGVMSPELAIAAIEHGCAGIQLSNHGGRQLDDVAASVTVLPLIPNAVHGRATIIIDSVIRRGQEYSKLSPSGPAPLPSAGRCFMVSRLVAGWAYRPPLSISTANSK